VIGDDTDKIERAKEVFRDQACIHIHDHKEEDECHHHEENNFFNFLMNYELEEKYAIKE
jgi:hypothetical protein